MLRETALAEGASAEQFETLEVPVKQEIHFKPTPPPALRSASSSLAVAAAVQVQSASSQGEQAVAQVSHGSGIAEVARASSLSSFR